VKAAPGGSAPVAPRRDPPPLATTGIGSLPHTQLELALQQAFQVDIPLFPLDSPHEERKMH